MAESMGGDMGLQVLQAVQVLSEQVKGLSEQVKGLGEKVGSLMVRVERLEGRMSAVEARLGLLETRVDQVEAQREKQDKWAERLGIELMQTREVVQQIRKDLQTDIHGVRTELKAELQGVRDEMRTELHLGLRQMNDRLDRNNDALVLMVSGLHRMTTERFEATEQHLRALGIR